MPATQFTVCAVVRKNSWHISGHKKKHFQFITDKIHYLPALLIFDIDSF